MAKREPRAFQLARYEVKRSREALSAEVDEVYELTCSAWPAGRLVVRVARSGDETMLSARKTPSLLAAERVWVKSLSAGEWHTLQQALRDADFWRLPECFPQTALDGESWTLTGRLGEQFHSSSGWSPGEGPFCELGRLFAKLAGATLPRSAP